MRAYRRLGLLIGFLSASLGPSPARAGDAVAVVRQGKATTALVLREEGGAATGSAFCINALGLFITNAHVVKGVPVGGRVKLVLNGGEPEQKNYAAVVVKAGAGSTEAKDDLALLKITQDVELPALSLGRTDELIETTPVLAFGYPFGQALATDATRCPNISVSTGKVTSLRKDAGKLVLIQLDASLNPGNSGGPILDEKGRVIGVAWAGVPGAAVNFAIPAEAVQAFVSQPMVFFDPPRIPYANRSKPQPLTIKLVSPARPEAAYQVEVVMGSGDETRRVAAERAADGSYRATVTPVPATAGPAKSLQATVTWEKGVLTGELADRSFRVGDREVKLNQVLCVEFKPEVSVTLTDGGILKGNVSGLDKISVEVGGTAIPVAPGSALRLSISPERVYLGEPLPCRVVVREGGHIVAEVSRPLEFVLPEAPLTVAPARPAATGPAAAEGAAVIPDLRDAPLTRNLPGTVDDALLGGGGRYVLLAMRQVKKIGVFEVRTGKLERFIPLAFDEPLLCAGVEKLFVADPLKNIVLRYNLATGEKELTTKLPVKGVICNLAMGWNARSPLLVRHSPGTEALDRSEFTFVDAQSLRPLETGEWEARSCLHSYRDIGHIRASGEGSVFGLWCTSHSPSGLQSIQFHGRSVASFYEHNSAGHVVPSADGKFVLTGCGGVFGVTLKPLSPRSERGAGRAMAVPSTHPAYYLSIANASGFSGRKEPVRVSVCVIGTDTPLATLDDLAEMSSSQNESWTKSDFTTDKRFFYVHDAGLLITIPYTNDRLVLRRLDLLSHLEKSGLDYLFVHSIPVVSAAKGKVYSYQVDVNSKRGGVKYKLDGPPGMSISPAGLIAWSVPATFGEKEAPVIVTIGDAAGQETFHSFNISVTP
jgi:V8-like Glu-specific endopeptidase